MKLFGSSGIRGVYGEKITPELAMKIGRVIGSMYTKCVVGRDPRLTGEVMSSALMSGLMAAGCDVVDIGIVSTPTLALATKNFDCGLMVTASHNPPQYNGIKFWNPDGTSFGVAQMQDVEDRILNDEWVPATWENVGTYSFYPNAVHDHINAIKNALKKDSEQPLDGLTVVLDCGNGGGSVVAPRVWRALGAKVIEMNCDPDGRFSARDPEPEEENLGLLKELVVKAGADLGIAHDGDADRMTAVDEKGRFVGGDLLMLIFAREYAGKKVVVPVNATMAVDDLVGRENVHRCRVGDVFVSEKLKEIGGDFGGEPSATWVFSSYGLFPDGVFAGVKLGTIVKNAIENGASFSAVVDGLPRYPIYRKNYSFPPEKREEVVEKVYSRLRELGGRITDVDGIRVDFDDGWVLVRASGTESKFRSTAEAREDRRARELFEMADRVVVGTIKETVA